MKAVTQLATVCLIVHAMPVRVRDMLQHLLLTRMPPQWFVFPVVHHLKIADCSFHFELYLLFVNETSEQLQLLIVYFNLYCLFLIVKEQWPLQ